MTRELTSHRVNGLNEALTIEVLDEPGFGNACHRYLVRFIGPPIADEFVSHPGPQTERDRERRVAVEFQNGPIQQAGVNGISNEALLAIVEDRLLGFQAGQYACRENAIALTHIQDAMMWLQKRTRDRLARGVEGTNQN